MIVLDRLTKVVTIANHKRMVLSSVSVTIPSDRKIALFATSELDRKVLVHLLTGTTLPTAGTYSKPGRVSFPIGTLPGASKELSVHANVAHVARLYGMDVKKTVTFVEQVTGIGEHFAKPFALLPRNLVRPLAQVIGFSLPFDFYVTISEPPRGGGALGDRCHALLEMRAAEAGMIISARGPRFALDRCNMSLLLHEGQLWLFDTVEEGWDTRQRLGGQETEPLEVSVDESSFEFL